MKDIQGYEGLYSISAEGRVYNLKTNKYLSGGLDKDGYRRVTLTKNSVKKDFKVHRLVAEAFLPNPDNKPQVNHKDENKQNNNVENLEWVTAEENVNYGTRGERAGKKISQSLINNPLISRSVVCVETGEVYPSTREAERATGANHSGISKVCKGQRKTCGGYHWRYANEQQLLG